VSPSVASDQGAYWDEVYRGKRSDRLSWFQRHPSLSLELITAAAPDPDARIIDVGGGDSLLVDHLLEQGYREITVLDISSSAIERAQSRLGTTADTVRWVVGDVLTMGALGTFDVWHDRALFHFLIDRNQRQQYVAAATNTIVPQGAVIIATFAPDGPTTCSGLEVRRYDESSLAVEPANGYEVAAVRDTQVWICPAEDLIKGAVEELGVPASTTTIEPFVQPTLCVAHLYNKTRSVRTMTP
jgi:2-polyprenyl-3-methyl-5-hydroxy-6-metoxy-1,4-benzoquinol methylase